MLLKREGRPRPGIKVVGSILLLVTISAMLGGCAWIHDWLNPNQAPIAVIIANPTSGEAPLEVTFDASESYDPNGDTITYEWDFDDDTVAEEEIVHHGFGSAGSYTVRLLVTDSKGKSDKASKTISVSQASDESTEEQTFDGQDGIEYDSGTGLKVSVPPAPSGEYLRLVVTENPTPQQPEGGFIELQSVYNVSLTQETSSQEQRITPKNALENNSMVRLTFEIPPGVDPHNVMILQWTDEGWVLASLGEGSEAIESLGGVLSPDRRSISIEVDRAMLAEAMPSSDLQVHAWSQPQFNPMFATGVLDTARYVASQVFTGPRAEEEPLELSSDSIIKTINFYSLRHLVFGGIWYKVEIANGQGLLDHGFPTWKPSWPENSFLALVVAGIDPNGCYLSAAKDGTPGVLALKFERAGGKATVSFDAINALGLQLLEWVSFKGASVDLVTDRADDLRKAIEEYWSGIGSGKLGILGAFRQLGKILWEAFPETFAKMVWEIIKSPLVFPEVLVYLGHVSSSPYGHYEFPYSVESKMPATSILYAPRDTTLSASEAGKAHTIKFDYEVTLGNYNHYFTAIITPGGDTYHKEIQHSGSYTGELIYTAPGVGETKSFEIQGQMCSTPQGQSNSDSSTVSFMVTTAKPADLTAHSVSFSKSSAQVGDTISVSFTVKNQGGSTPGQFTYAVFFATTKWGTTVLADEFSWPGVLPLTPGLSLEMKEEIVIPQVPDGDYYVTVYVDNKEQVAESDKNNNIGSTYPDKISISSGPVKTLDRVTLSGVNEVNESSSADYTCTAHYSDGTSSNVSSQATWSVNPAYATISSSGRLSVGSLSSDKTCSITARYTYEGVTRSASKSVTLKNEPEPTILDHLVITGLGELFENTSANYTCTAHFSDGSTTDVTNLATWQVGTSGGIEASITSSGCLTVGAIPSAGEVCWIVAKYTYNGLTKSASKQASLRYVPKGKALNYVTITGPSKAYENTTVAYTCTAYFSNGDSEDISTLANWDVTSAFATIDSRGRLSVGDLSSDQSCTVTANYTYDGVTRAVEKSVILCIRPSSAITITVYVFESTWGNPPLADVRVEGRDGAGETFNQLTDNQGYAYIQGAPGTWEIEVSKQGYMGFSWRETYTASKVQKASMERSCGYPMACFTYSPEIPTTETPVSFTDCSTHGQPRFCDEPAYNTSWSWDFGDGTTSNVQNPTHQFSTSGTYTVCLVGSS